MAKFKFNHGAVDRLLRQSVDNLADKLTRALNNLTPTYQGKPVDEVKVVVQRAWGENSGGGALPEPQLTEFATAIANGRHVQVNGVVG
ncbi:hypothetical protein [Streptomyces sp. NPDC056069]|uniref:hypothetical protein n=1 Tax=Streptomyces sp. NPDC056069 TaxID=3345702 RepID=UPI0035D7133B